MPNRYLGLRQSEHELRTEALALDLGTDEGTARFAALEAELATVRASLLVEERRRELERTLPAIVPIEPSGLISQTIFGQPERFTSLADQLMAVRMAASPGMIDQRLLGINAAALGNQVGSDSAGGFLLQSDYSAGLWQRAYDIGSILSRCFRVPIGDQADSVKINGSDETSRATGSRWGGVRAYWVAEAATLTASTPKFRQIELAPKKLAVLVYATSEMLRNPTTLEAVVNRVVPEELMFMAEAAAFSGDGSGKPAGFSVCPARVSVTAETGQAAATIVGENISKMWSRCWGRSRQNAVWYVNQDVEPQLDTLSLQVGVGGMPTYMPPGGLADLPYGRLKGRPVIPVEYASTLGTLGDIVLADPSQYAISDRGSVKVASSIHVQFLTDQSVFRFIYEIDGESLWTSALTPFSGSGNTLSPFIVLATRS